MIRTTCLTSGCWVVTEVIPGARSVALGVMIEAGSQVEPDAAQGAAHLLEHLLFRGADGLEEAVLSDALDRLGGDSNAFTDKEVMTAYVRTIPERSASALDLLVRVTQRPLLDAQHIEAEQSIVLDELLARNDEGGELAQLVRTRVAACLRRLCSDGGAGGGHVWALEHPRVFVGAVRSAAEVQLVQVGGRADGQWAGRGESAGGSQAPQAQ